VRGVAGGVSALEERAVAPGAQLARLGRGRRNVKETQRLLGLLATVRDTQVGEGGGGARGAAAALVNLGGRPLAAVPRAPARLCVRDDWDDWDDWDFLRGGGARGAGGREGWLSGAGGAGAWMRIQANIQLLLANEEYGAASALIRSTQHTMLGPGGQV
jgi:hypothetical protein